MTATVSFDRTQLAPADPQGSAPAAAPDRRRVPRPARAPRDRGRGSLRWSWVPALISVSVNALFLVSWSAPEFGEYAGRDALLGQLWPLASAELTSAGAAVIPAQQGHLGLLAALMLVTSVALPFLARSTKRPVRVFVPASAVYVGALTWLVTLVQALSASTTDQPWLALVLTAVWVATAAITVWRSRFVAAADLPVGRAPIGWLVVVFALLYPLPIALGRALFAPEVAAAARGLLTADPTQQLAVLFTGSTVLAYVAGVLIALLGWALYMLVPPYDRIRVPWVRRRPVTVDALVARIAAVVLCATALVLVAFPAAEAGRDQARSWLADNPTGGQLSCGTWEQQRPGRPTAVLVSGGDRCRSLTAYAGYKRSSSSQAGLALSPVKATTPDKKPITSRVVAGQYGATVVLAGTGAVDLAPDELLGISMDAAATVWRFRCDDDGTMRLRFAGSDLAPGVPAAAQAAAGHITEPGEQPGVVVACANQSVRLDPATGHPIA